MIAERNILDELKFHCRIDDDLDEDINKKINQEIENLKISAEIYLKNAGIKINYDNELYFVVIKMLVSNWYENKDISSSKNKEIPFGATVIINQLQFSNLGGNA
ncbi:MAG: head-tail connector protein [Clostridium sp.]